MPYYESMFGGGNYSETEQKTGQYWIDGKEIFRKVIDFGALPNNATKRVVHGISNLGTVIKLWGVATSGGSRLPLPFVDTSILGGQIRVLAETYEVIAQTGMDRSSFSAYIIIEYTKSS